MRNPPDTGTSPAAPPSYRSLFAFPPYRRLWAGQTLSLLGDSIARVAMPVLVVSISGNANILPLLFALQQVPWLLGPFAGILADRFDRRSIVRIALAIEAVSILGIGCTSSVETILVLAFVAGCCQVVQAPARAAGMPELLGGLFSVGLAATTATIQISEVVGQAVGGLLMLEISARVLLVADAVSFLFYAFLVPKLPNASSRAAANRPSITHGFRRLWNDTSLRSVVSVMIARGLTLTAALLSLPYAIVVHRQGGPVSFGLLVSVMTFSLTVGSLLTGKLAKIENGARALLATTIVAGLAVVPIVVNPPLPVIAVFLAVGALLFAPGNIIANGMLSLRAEPDERGQVIAAAFVMIKAGQVVGGLAMVGVLELCRPAEALAIAGAALALLTIGLWPAARWSWEG
ncbi:MFS transporter [Nocardia carnea]|uniref:MFS transporter n=1 Tax=Nocardia carnea TaxID=37328 RepID=UPI0024567508|nr:MFS transporter [Nocardia carnea]